MEFTQAHPPMLLDRVRQAIRVRHYSRHTEEAYVTRIGFFAGIVAGTVPDSAVSVAD